MNRSSRFRFLPAACVAIAALGTTPSLLACAACYGRSDSRLAVGMNWGIFTLLIVVGTVLSGFASFGVYLARRSAAMTETTPPADGVAASSTARL